ncbi:hypothetical protein K3495_g8036 [Podosphaera aphanis]|nr:hypothetical protein K3495_g8036 [Podosphaera aphanis]
MLGIEIEVDIKNHAIRLSQERYINKIIDRFDLNNERLSDIPMTPHAKFSPSKDDENLVNITLYRSAIGSLMYVAIATRPDIAFAVNTLAQSNVKPSQTHWDAVIKNFRHLKGTKSLGLLYDQSKETRTFEVTGFTDAGNGTDMTTGCPTSGGVYILAGGAIKWISERQRGATLSEMESEFVASCKISQAGIWIRDLLADLGLAQGLINIWIDNSASARIIENSESHKRALHIQRKYFWIQQQCEQGNVKLHKIDTSKNVADIQ